MTNFLRTALNAKRGYDGKDKSKMISPKEFRSMLKGELEVLHMDDSFLPRYINDGFSGGEKKRAQILQMAMLKPEIAILDETDSGLDIDSIKFVAEAVNRMRGPELGVLIITHYTRILEFIKPDFVHVLVDGKFVLSGGPRSLPAGEDRVIPEWAEADEPAVLKPERRLPDGDSTQGRRRVRLQGEVRLLRPRGLHLQGQARPEPRDRHRSRG
jgi:Fe-S cluster assembly ATP-binding protein